MSERDVLLDLVDRIRSEAEIASRAGQYYSLQQVADELEAAVRRLESEKVRP